MAFPGFSGSSYSCTRAAVQPAASLSTADRHTKTECVRRVCRGSAQSWVGEQLAAHPGSRLKRALVENAACSTVAGSGQADWVDDVSVGARGRPVRAVGERLAGLKWHGASPWALSGDGGTDRP